MSQDCVLNKIQEYLQCVLNKIQEYLLHKILAERSMLFNKEWEQIRCYVNCIQPIKDSLYYRLDQVVKCVCLNQQLRSANMCASLDLYMYYISIPNYSGTRAQLFPKPGVYNTASYYFWTGWYKEDQVNEAAIQLALETPSLLSSRQILLETGRKKVNNDGYVYKKGKSRSKQFFQTEECAPKRVKTSEVFRVKRMSALEEDIKDFNDRLSFKEKRRSQASNSRNYKLCDMLTKELSAIKQSGKRNCMNSKGNKRSIRGTKKSKVSWALKFPESDESELSGTQTNLLSRSTSPQGLPEGPSPSPVYSTPVSSVATTPVNFPSPHSSRRHSSSHNSYPGSPTFSSSPSTPYTFISTDHRVCADEQSQESQHFQ